MKYLDDALEMIRIGLTTLEPSEKDAMNVEVVAEEIITNIISYAYDEDSNAIDKYVEVELHIDKASNKIFILFKDSGRPYNPLEKADPDFELDIMDRPIGGLGIYMTKKLMDKITYEYSEGLNILSIEKVIKN